MKLKIFLHLIFCIFLFGCEKSPKVPGIYVTEKSVLIEEMTPKMTIVKINGESITKHDYDVMQNMFEKLFCLQRGIQTTSPNKESARYKKNREQKTPEDLVRRKLMDQAFDDEGLTLTKEELQAYLNSRFKGLRKEKKTFIEVSETLGGEEGELFLKLAEEDLKSEKLRAFWGKGKLNVSEKEIDEGLERVKDFNLRADASNALMRVRSSEVFSKLLSGEKFAELAKIYSFIYPEEGEEWGEFVLEEFPENFKLKSWLSVAKEGDVSALIEMDDGISIVKLLKKGQLEIAEGMEESSTYKLARITFPVWEKADEMSRDEVKEELFRYKRDLVQKEFGAKIFENAVFEYPNGTNFFTNVKQSL